MNTHLYMCFLSLLITVGANHLKVGGKCANFHEPTLGGNVHIPRYFFRHAETRDDYFISLRLRDAMMKCDENTAIRHVEHWEQPQNMTEIKSRQITGVRRYYYENEASQPIPVHFSKNGQFFNGTYYFRPNGEYCIESYTNQSVSLKLCPPDPRTDIFIPKCCSIDEFVYLSRRCSPLNSTQPRWTPNLYSEENIHGPPLNYQRENLRLYNTDVASKCTKVTQSLKYHFEWWSPTGMSSPRYHKTKLVLRKNGTVVPFVYENETRRWTSKAHVHFCVDGTFKLTGEKSVTYRGYPDEFVVYYCNSEDSTVPALQPRKTLVHTITLTISCIFLLIIVMVYLVLFKQHKISGLLILAYSIALLGSSFFNLWAYFISIYPEPDYFGVYDRGWPCICIAVAAHYFDLVVMFCLTALNMHLLYTISSLRPPQSTEAQLRQVGCSLGYFAFAWGFPFILVASFSVIDYVYQDPYTEIPVPGYGDLNVCYVSRPFRSYYVYLPTAIIYGMNIPLIILLVIILYKNHKRSKKTFGKNQCTGSEISNIYLLLKVFTVMGGTKFINLFKWYFYEPNPSGEKPLWLLCLEAVNFVTPVVLFFLFCCNQRIIDDLKNKFK